MKATIDATVDEIVIALGRALKEIEQLRQENAYLREWQKIALKYIPAEWFDEQQD